MVTFRLQKTMTARPRVGRGQQSGRVGEREDCHENEEIHEGPGVHGQPDVQNNTDGLRATMALKMFSDRMWAPLRGVALRITAARERG